MTTKTSIHKIDGKLSADDQEFKAKLAAVSLCAVSAFSTLGLFASVPVIAQMTSSSNQLLSSQLQHNLPKLIHAEKL